MTLLSGRRAALAAVILIAAAGSVRPFEASAPQAREALAVDFYVLGPDGQSVTDLRPDEVTIRTDGRTRVIRSLQHVVQGPVPATDEPAAAPVLEPPPPPYATNAATDAGRSIIIVVDDESFRPGRERPLRAAVGRFLGSLTSRDRVALITVPHGGMKTDLTTNHDRVSGALELVTGHGPENESAQEGACRSRTVLESLAGMLSSLAGGEGPTTVIFVSTSMYGPRRDAPVSLAPGMCELTTQHFQRVGQAAARARAHLFILQPEDVMGRGTRMDETIAGANFTGSANPLEGLENLAGVTTAHRASLSEAGDETLVKLAAETASYYSATIEVAPSEFDDLNRGLQVRVSRPGVELRARPMLYFPKANAPGPRPAVKSAAEMLLETRPFRDLPLRAAAYTSINDDARLRVIVAAEPMDAGERLQALSAALFADGKLISRWDAEAQHLATMPVLAALVAPAGSYRLRVTAVDAAGRGGAVDADLDVGVVEAGPLRISSVVLGLSRGGAFQPRLEFTSEPVAIGYVELYGGTAGASVTALIEIARSATGPAIIATPLAIEASRDTGRFLAQGAVPIGALPPGDYVIRALVGVEGQPMGRVMRTIRKR
jgi:VWFA-related protein